MDLARTREESSWVERAAVSSRKYWTGNNCGQRIGRKRERESEEQNLSLDKWKVKK